MYLLKLLVVVVALLVSTPAEGSAQSSGNRFSGWEPDSSYDDMSGRWLWEVTGAAHESSAIIPSVDLSAVCSQGRIYVVLSEIYLNGEGGFRTQMRIRFDQAAVVRTTWTLTRGLDKLFLATGGDQWLSRVARSDTTRVEMRSVSGGPTIFKFPGAGLAEQLQWLRSRCRPTRKAPS